MRILLIGRTGQLGGDLLRNNTVHEIIAPERAVLDVMNPDEVREALREYNPALVINCAAFHNVPLCEQQPDQAFRVNCVAMRDLAIACREADTRLVTFSSDYVFGSDRREPHVESALPHPLQIYGISRLAGEHAVMAAAPAHGIVIRTCGLYGRSGASSKGGNFVDGRVADALAGKTIEMACEQVVSPTSTDDLSRAVFDLIVHPGAGPGIYHLVNSGACSWYEFTCEIVRCIGASAKVVPVDRGGQTQGMRRPLFSALANVRASSLGIALRPWQDAVAAYLRAKYPQAA